MRYSLLAVAVSCTLVLTACNKSTETTEPAADSSSAVTTTEATTQTTSASAAGFKSAENIAMNITGAGASFPQLSMLNGLTTITLLPVVKSITSRLALLVVSNKSNQRQSILGRLTRR